MTAYREIRAEYNTSTIVVYQAYNDAIVDLTPLAHKLRGMRQAGKHSAAKRLFPVERIYSTPADTAKRLGISGSKPNV